ncbi:hypothetical protein BD289DRAFT_427823 [Coniella lustricola]|uniref:Uncharacterized protein n=1 Tax=Coniella lustricola TaxID=2025994 RepID=A0A2T3AES4_9PEZI|nr:hypothetical protein BD289DRAFT_427823 [Coniella lustricola]
MLLACSPLSRPSVWPLGLSLAARTSRSARNRPEKPISKPSSNQAKPRPSWRNQLPWPPSSSQFHNQAQPFACKWQQQSQPRVAHHTMCCLLETPNISVAAVGSWRAESRLWRPLCFQPCLSGAHPHFGPSNHSAASQLIALHSTHLHTTHADNTRLGSSPGIVTASKRSLSPVISRSSTWLLQLLLRLQCLPLLPPDLMMTMHAARCFAVLFLYIPGGARDAQTLGCR